jgi:hypothetical protein
LTDGAAQDAARNMPAESPARHKKEVDIFFIFTKGIIINVELLVVGY